MNQLNTVTCVIVMSVSQTPLIRGAGEIEVDDGDKLHV